MPLLAGYHLIHRRVPHRLTGIVVSVLLLPTCSIVTHFAPTGDIFVALKSSVIFSKKPISFPKTSAIFVSFFTFCCYSGKTQASIVCRKLLAFFLS